MISVAGYLRYQNVKDSKVKKSLHPDAGCEIGGQGSFQLRKPTPFKKRLI